MLKLTLHRLSKLSQVTQPGTARFSCLVADKPLFPVSLFGAFLKKIRLRALFYTSLPLQLVRKQLTWASLASLILSVVLLPIPPTEAIKVSLCFKTSLKWKGFGPHWTWIRHVNGLLF